MLQCCIPCFLVINLRFIRGYTRTIRILLWFFLVYQLNIFPFNFCFVNYSVVYKSKGERKDVELVEEEEPQIGADCSSASSNKYEIYKEESANAAQKHKLKRVKCVNADAEAFGDSAKVVIKQDMKGGEHKYGFNNNKREKPQKVRLVDDETGDKHELFEVLRMPSRCVFLKDHGFSNCLPSSSSSFCSFGRIGFAVCREADTQSLTSMIVAEFEILEASDSRMKRKLLQTVGERWRQFKSDLTRKWALAADQDGVEDTTCEKYDISKEKWAQFCQTRRDPSWEDVRKKAQAIQKQNIAPHVLSHGGYDYLEHKLLAEKTKKKLEEAA
ncbi:hypothetical protein HKD37_03G006789 [Glycine soja]